jgi:hypothetical protein
MAQLSPALATRRSQTLPPYLWLCSSSSESKSHNIWVVSARFAVFLVLVTFALAEVSRADDESSLRVSKHDFQAKLAYCEQCHGSRTLLAPRTQAGRTGKLR